MEAECYADSRQALSDAIVIQFGFFRHYGSGAAEKGQSVTLRLRKARGKGLLGPIAKYLCRVYNLDHARRAWDRRPENHGGLGICRVGAAAIFAARPAEEQRAWTHWLASTRNSARR